MIETSIVCSLAWGPDADRRAEPLIYHAIEGSILAPAAPLREIMLSAAVDKAPKNLRSHHAAPHNAQLRIIGFMRCTA